MLFCNHLTTLIHIFYIPINCTYTDIKTVFFKFWYTTLIGSQLQGSICCEVKTIIKTEHYVMYSKHPKNFGKWRKRLSLLVKWYSKVLKKWLEPALDADYNEPFVLYVVLCRDNNIMFSTWTATTSISAAFCSAPLSPSSQDANMSRMWMSSQSGRNSSCTQ